MDLKLGSTGSDVERLQQKLTALGIYSGPVNGTYNGPVESAAVAEPWKSRFFALGQTPEFQSIQLAQAECFHKDAVAMCGHFGLVTERALALMFDIRVQNGAIASAVEASIRADFAAIPAGTTP